METKVCVCADRANNGNKNKKKNKHKNNIIKMSSELISDPMSFKI